MSERTINMGHNASEDQTGEEEERRGESGIFNWAVFSFVPVLLLYGELVNWFKLGWVS